jgi:hypothetical protein
MELQRHCPCWAACDPQEKNWAQVAGDQCPQMAQVVGWAMKGGDVGLV